MSTSQDDLVITGGEPTVEEMSYIEWGEKAAQNAFTFVNEVLRQFITLNTAFIGGGILLMNEKLINPHCRTLALVLFVASLCASLFGIMPREAQVNMLKPYDLRDAQRNGLKIKNRCLQAAAVTFALALFVAIVGVLLGGPSHFPSP